MTTSENAQADTEVEPDVVVGTWSMSRMLLDRRSEERGTVDGSITIAERPDGGFDWHESGSMDWSGRVVQARRELGVQRHEGEWWVVFENGRLFHPWQIGGEVEHLCKNDIYRGTIELLDHAEDGVLMEWRIVWEVHGPGKNQRIDSWLRRTSR